MIARSNARLVEIEGKGFSADYDLPAGEQGHKWAGDLPAYLVERVTSSHSGDRSDQVKRAELYVQRPLPGSIEIVSGDTVTYTFEGTSQAREVRNVEHRPVAGTTKLYLKDQ